MDGNRVGPEVPCCVTPGHRQKYRSRMQPVSGLDLLVRTTGFSFGWLTGARRGTYRIVYRIDANSDTVDVRLINHRDRGCGGGSGAAWRMLAAWPEVWSVLALPEPAVLDPVAAGLQPLPGAVVLCVADREQQDH